MEFRDYASTEAAALIGRLLGSRSAHTSHEIEAFRHAIDEAAKAVGAALDASAPAEADSEVASLVERLTALAATQTEAATARVSTQAQATIDAVRKELAEHTRRTEQLASSLKQARAQTESLETEMRAEKRAAEAARVELAQVKKAQQQSDEALQEQVRAKSAIHRELQEAKKTLESVRAESASINRQIETEAADRAKLAAALRATQDQLQAAETQRQTLSGQLAASATRLKAVEDAGGTHDRTRRELEAKLEATSASEQTLRQKLADAQRAVEAARADAESASHAARRKIVELEQAVANAEAKRGSEPSGASRDQLVRAAALPIDWLLAAFQKLAMSDTLSGVLTAMVEALANDFPRVVLFNVKGSRLEGEHQVGFTFDRDVSDVVVPLGTDSLLARAVTSCRIQGASAGELSDSSRALLGGAPNFVLVIPVAVRKKALAVIYADDGGQPHIDGATPERKAKFAQLLLWQAMPRLPKILNEGKAVAKAG